MGERTRPTKPYDEAEGYARIQAAQQRKEDRVQRAKSATRRRTKQARKTKQQNRSK